MGKLCGISTREIFGLGKSGGISTTPQVYVIYLVEQLKKYQPIFSFCLSMNIYISLYDLIFHFSGIPHSLVLHLGVGIDNFD